MARHQLETDYVVTRGKNTGKKYNFRCKKCLKKWQNKPDSSCGGKVDFSKFKTSKESKRSKSSSNSSSKRSSSGGTSGKSTGSFSEDRSIKLEGKLPIREFSQIPRGTTSQKAKNPALLKEFTNKQIESMAIQKGGVGNMSIDLKSSFRRNVLYTKKAQGLTDIYYSTKKLKVQEDQQDG